METDVVIVGGGPAGASAAYFLCNRGFKVILVERLGNESFDRYHSICGAGVSHIAVKDLNLREEEILNRVDTLRIRWPGGTQCNLKVRGYILDRPKLFMRLRKEAEERGLVIIKSSVVGVSQENGICTVILSTGAEIRSKYVIGADGAYSVVRKRIFSTTPGLMLKVVEYHSSAETADGVFDFVISEKYNHFYQWYFPYRDGRCAGAINGYAEDEAYSEKGVRTIPLGWVPELVKGNVFLIGDAGGLPNPLTAGGLRTAIASARYVTEAISKNRPTLYQKRWERSRMSDRRFSEVQHVFRSYSDEDYRAFSKHMVHKGLWINGIHSVLCCPRKTWLYIGCLMSLRYGW